MLCIGFNMIMAVTGHWPMRQGQASLMLCIGFNMTMTVAGHWSLASVF
jgi:hypothetical protein